MSLFVRLSWYSRSRAVASFQRNAFGVLRPKPLNFSRWSGLPGWMLPSGWCIRCPFLWCSLHPCELLLPISANGHWGRSSTSNSSLTLKRSTRVGPSMFPRPFFNSGGHSMSQHATTCPHDTTSFQGLCLIFSLMYRRFPRSAMSSWDGDGCTQPNED